MHAGLNLGWAMVIMVLVGVVGHGLMRIVTNKRNS
jgi:hypothetical protein